MRQQARFGSKRPPVVDDSARLISFLYQCTPPVLAATTLEALCQRHPRIDRRKVEYELTIAKQKREGEAG